MPIQSPLLPDHFLTWTEPPDENGDEVWRVVSWRRSVTLKGHSFREFARKVVPLLDGRHDLDGICDAVADTFAPGDLVAALETLEGQGIVVDAAPAEERGDTDPLARLLPQMGWLAETAPEGRAAQRHLSGARVVLFGAGGPGAVLARNLAAAGIGELLIVDGETVSATDPYFSALYRASDLGQPRATVLAAALATLAPDTRVAAHPARPRDRAAIAELLQGAAMALCCLESADLNLALKLNRACRDMGMRWLAGSLESLDLVVGPGFSGDPDAPCYLCWRMREVASAANPQARFALERHLDRLHSDLSGRRENLSVGADIVGGMMAAEVLAILTGAGEPMLDGRLLVIQLPGLHQDKHSVLRKPGCPVCGTGG